MSQLHNSGKHLLKFEEHVKITKVNPFTQEF